MVAAIKQPEKGNVEQFPATALPGEKQPAPQAIERQLCHEQDQGLALCAEPAAPPDQPCRDRH